MKAKKVLFQFVKYCFAGGIAFILDFLTLTFVHVVLLRNSAYGVYLGAAIGFIIGTITNYTISKKAVFCSSNVHDQKVGLEFTIFLLIGLFGLLITEFGMYLGTKVLCISYAIVKVFMAILVLIWNFIARRFLLYKGGDNN